MKAKSELDSLYWSLVIMVCGLIIIAYLIANNLTKNKEINFSCSSQFKSTLSIHKSKMAFDGVLLLAGYSPEHFSLSVRGELKSDTGQFVVNRKLYFHYASKISPNAGVYMITPERREKGPDDNATDDIDYLLFDIYNGTDKLYLVKRINSETAIIGDSFSPRFACVINHLTG